MIKVDDLVDICAFACKIDKEKIFKRDRSRDVIMARHIFCFYARNYLNMRLNIIGDYLDIHHSSVIHAIDKVKMFKEIKDDLYCAALQKVNDIIRSEYEKDIKLIVYLPFDVNVNELGNMLMENYGAKAIRVNEI